MSRSVVIGVEAHLHQRSSSKLVCRAVGGPPFRPPYLHHIRYRDVWLTAELSNRLLIYNNSLDRHAKKIV